MFLILRCRPSDALKQLDALRNYAHELGIDKTGVQCPTIRVEKRVGRNRERVECDVPLLGNFLFIQWTGDLYWANYVERKFPFVKIMRLPHGGYATCSDKEVYAIDHWVVPEPSILGPECIFRKGDEVSVKAGTFLAEVEGIVMDVRRSGEVKLKITKDGGLNLSTLLLHGSLLTVRVNASLEAPGMSV